MPRKGSIIICTPELREDAGQVTDRNLRERRPAMGRYRGLAAGLVMTVLAACLAGCGAKSSGEDRERLPKKTMEHSVRMDEDAHRDVLKARIEYIERDGDGVVLTEHCLYEEAGEGLVVQRDHQGKELSRHRLDSKGDGFALYCGSEKRIIYENGVRNLYSVPVSQTEGGETVFWEQSEKVAAYQGEFTYVCLCEPYLIYGEDDNTLVRLDLDTGDRKTMEFPLSNATIKRFSAGEEWLYLTDVGSGIVYRLHPGEWKVEKLYEGRDPGEMIECITVDGSFLFLEFFSEDDYDRIECFDMEQQKTVGKLSAAEVRPLLQAEGLWKDTAIESIIRSDGSSVYRDEINFVGLSVYHGRVYFLLDFREKLGILFSCQENDLSDLQMEEEFMDWMEQADFDQSENSPRGGLGGYGDLYYVHYYDSQIKEHLVRYHLDTKQWEEVGENELIWLAYQAVGWWP